MVQPALSSVTEESLSAVIAMEEKGGGGNEHLQGDNNIATYNLMVLDILVQPAPYRLHKLVIGYLAPGYIARDFWLYSHWLYSQKSLAI